MHVKVQMAGTLMTDRPRSRLAQISVAYRSRRRPFEVTVKSEITNPAIISANFPFKLKVPDARTSGHYQVLLRVY